MAIDGTTLFEQKVRQYKAEASSNRFKDDYIHAVNNSLDKYSLKLNIAHPAHISRTDASIDIDANRGYVLGAGIDYWLIKFGHRDGDLTEREAKVNFDDAIADAITDQNHDDMAAADNEEIIANIPADD